MTTNICLNFSLDSVTLWLHAFGGKNQPSRISRGEFGANVGAPRLLKLLGKYDLPATWFLPGHTIESFPEICGEIADRGYEIPLHGWKHKSPTTFESKEAEREDLVRGIEAIYDLCGRKPSGYRSPASDFSENTVELIEELDMQFDSSLQGNDFSPYYLHNTGEVSLDEPYDRGRPTDIVEIPFTWLLVDLVPFTFIWSDPYKVGYADEEVFYRRWREIVDWVSENMTNGVIMPIIHPQVAGRLPRFKYLDDFLGYLSEKDDIRFVDMETVASEFKDGKEFGTLNW